MGGMLLYLLKILKPLLIRQGVQFDSMYSIVMAKLIIDKRRVSSFNQFAKTKDYSTDVILGVMYFLIGIVFLIFLTIFESPHTGFSLYFTVLIFYVVFTLVSDFSEVLFDIRDNYLILPTPINEVTLIYSKLFHLLIYMIKMYLPFLLPAFILVAIKYSFWALLLFFFQSFLCLTIAILFVNILYLLVFKYVDANTFKDIINYFQIAVVVIAITAYYFLSGFYSDDNFKFDLLLETYWLSYLSPGVWIAGLTRILIETKYDTYSIVLSILALVIPMICLVLVSRFFSRGYISNLLLLDTGSKGKAISGSENSSRYVLGSFLSKVFRWDAVEMAGYKFSMQMTGRSRTFKLRTYPLYAFIPSIVFYNMMNNDGNSIQEKFTNIIEGRFDILISYSLVH